MGRNEWCSYKHSTMHSYPLQFSRHGSIWNLSGGALVDDLCQLNYSRVPVLPYNSSEMTPITLLENCTRTAVTSSREGLWVLIPTFENLCYGYFWESSDFCRLRNVGPGERSSILNPFSNGIKYCAAAECFCVYWVPHVHLWCTFFTKI